MTVFSQLLPTLLIYKYLAVLLLPLLQFRGSSFGLLWQRPLQVHSFDCDGYRWIDRFLQIRLRLIEWDGGMYAGQGVTSLWITQ